MKIEWNQYTGLPRIIFEDKDLLEMARIEEMYNGNIICQHCNRVTRHDGWKIFKGYLETEKIKLEEKIDSSVSAIKINGITEESTKVQVAKKIGFKHFMQLPEEIIKQRQKILKDRQTKETINDARNEY